MIIIMRWRDMCHTLRMFGHRHPQSKLSRQLKLRKAKRVRRGYYRIKVRSYGSSHASLFGLSSSVGCLAFAISVLSADAAPRLRASFRHPLRCQLFRHHIRRQGSHDWLFLSQSRERVASCLP
jgi:hypothetical protein